MVGKLRMLIMQTEDFLTITKKKNTIISIMRRL